MLWIPISGESMWPALRTGDRGCVEPLRGPLGAGAVVAARVGDRIVAHRVVAARGEVLTLQGDNCPAPDVPVPLSHVLGAISQIERGGRSLTREEWDRPASIPEYLRHCVQRGLRFLRAVFR